MFKIYGKENCSYCVAAKALLTRKGFDFQYYTIVPKINDSNDITLEQFKELFPEAKTVPQIQHNGTYIGGYEDLVKYVKSIWPAD